MSTFTRSNGMEHSAADGARPTSSQFLLVLPHERREGFWANIRGHVLDLADPGSGDPPTPVDLFIVSSASRLAWSARGFLQARGLPDDVSVSAAWTMREDPPIPADVTLTVTVSRRAEAVTSELAAAFASSLATRSAETPAVRIACDGASRD